jgi:uncharacterized membrane protein YecN with MAPEG domain
MMALLCLLLACAPAYAHVGSKNVFEEVSAPPYKLYVTIRPPNVIPGVATVEVRAIGAPVESIEITPTPMIGEASTHPPTPDKMKPSPVDKAFFTGSIWIMESGSWQVRFHIEGDAGARTVSIPVAAASLSTLKMSKGLTWLLAVLGLLLVCGMAGIVGAAMSESQLEPGVAPGPSRRRRGLVGMAASLAVMLAILWGGDRWWNVEAAIFASGLYRPPVVHAFLHGDVLDIRASSVESEEAFKVRANNDFILDHGKVMHLYAVREPQLDAVYHLHPEFVGDGDFRLKLPAMPPGNYKLYGDVVHANGFPETLVTTVDIPAGLPGIPLPADDAEAAPAPLSAGLLGASYKLPDGYTMVWDKPATLTADTAYAFHFELLDPQGKPPAHMRTYLGMAGHAAFLKTDGTVFAHVHPEGSAAMASMMLANHQGSTLAGADSGSSNTMDGMAGMSGMTMPATDADLSSNAVEFPYGFPSPGRYRIFVQMKHDQTVETGAFDAVVK